MRFSFYIVLIAFFLFGCKGEDTHNKNLDLNELSNKRGYALGYNLADNLGDELLDSINVNALVKGFTARKLDKQKMAIPEEEYRNIITALTNSMKKSRFERVKEIAKDNKQEEEDFLKENAKKENIHTTQHGLQYKVLKEGSGKKPQPDDEVLVSYTGYRLNGSKFDEGTKKKFNLNDTIKGWEIALPLMKEKSKWKIYVPSQLAYGVAGTPKIEPYETLIFEIELVEVL